MIPAPIIITETCAPPSRLLAILLLDRDLTEDEQREVDEAECDLWEDGL